MIVGQTMVDGESLARIVSWHSATFSFIVRLSFDRGSDSPESFEEVAWNPDLEEKGRSPKSCRPKAVARLLMGKDLFNCHLD
jgi:hypothetical protein